MELQKAGWNTDFFRLSASLNTNLHCVFWEKDDDYVIEENQTQNEELDDEEKTFEKNEIIIIYMHTNTFLLC